MPERNMSAKKSKKHEQTLKTWMGNSTENTNKQSKTTTKNDKTEEEWCNRLIRQGKSNTIKTKD